MDTNQLNQAALLGFDAGQKGPPTIKVVTGTDPAANTECSDTVPASKLWRLIAWAVTLVQGATQTPDPDLIIDDGTTEIVGFPLTSAAIDAATTTRLTATNGVALSAGGAATRNYAPLPSGLLLPAGWRIGTVTAGKGANTNYGAPAIYVAEYAV